MFVFLTQHCFLFNQTTFFTTKLLDIVLQWFLRLGSDCNERLVFTEAIKLLWKLLKTWYDTMKNKWECEEFLIKLQLSNVFFSCTKRKLKKKNLKRRYKTFFEVRTYLKNLASVFAYYLGYFGSWIRATLEEIFNIVLCLKRIVLIHFKF